MRRHWLKPLAWRSRRSDPGVYPAVNLGNAQAVAPLLGSRSLVMLLTGQVLQDGELVLLILKPSMWFIPFSCLRFAGVVLIILCAALLFDLPGRNISYVELAIFLLAGRLMWAILQWMGRLYILTDIRIVRLSGIFSVDIFDCPLRRVARVRLLQPVRERIARLGTMEIIPQDDALPVGQWQTVAHPYEVHDQITAAINHARQGHRPAN